MSESMSVVEIEDVLSSIRRLVSEDLRPTHKLVSAALQKGASKLILTPALRIVSDVRTALPDHSDAGGDVLELQSVLLDIEQDTTEEPAEILPMFGSVRVQEPFILTAPYRADTGKAVSSDADFLTTAMSRIHGLSVAGPSQSQRDTIEAVVASVGAAVGPEEWELDGGEPEPQAVAWAEPAWNNDAARDEPSVLGGAPDEAWQTDAAVLSDGVIETTAYDLQADTVLAPVEQSDHGQLIGQDSIVFNDSTAEKAKPLLLGAEGSNPAKDELDDAESFISEDLLREIVRDMIRDELQGTLGERITRNVRKLVRAEINRALASRDFDDVATHA